MNNKNLKPGHDMEKADENKKYYIYKNPFFSVFISIKNKRSAVKTEGVLAPVLKKFVEREMDFFNDKKIVKQCGKHLIFSTWLPPIPSTAFNRLVKSRMAGLLGQNKPEQMTISITEDCPNKCLHCALPNKNNNSKLNLDEAKSAIDQAISIGVSNIIFDGGEPLVYENLEELINYVDKRKAIAGMFTSGVGLTYEKANSLKEAGLYSITFSFDSAFEENHDKMRGRKGTYRNAVEGVGYAKNAGLLVNMYNVLGPHNIGEIYDLYSLAKELGADELSFYEIVPTGRWFEKTDFILSKEDHKKFKEFLREKEYEDGPRIFAGPEIIENFGCMAGKQWIHVTPEGDILPCSCIPIPYGNIKNGKNSMKSAWKKIENEKEYCNQKKCLMRDKEFREKKGLV